MVHTETLSRTQQALRAGFIGLLLVFSISILRTLSVREVVFALVAAGTAILLARKTAAHFHGMHTHGGDSPIDAVAPTVLFLANILHPAVDGFSLYETIQKGGAIAGVAMGLGIVVHEVFRQSALIAALRSFGIAWYFTVITALIGIGIGVVSGLLGTEALTRHEWLIDIATIFAYAFIIAEFYLSGHGERSKTVPYTSIGVAIGVVLVVYIGTH